MAPQVMKAVMKMLVTMVQTLFADRADLAIENLALRQQVAALKRERPRPQLNDLDRALWVVLRERWTGWIGSLLIVTPDTVVRWHKRSFKRHWRKLSRRRPGRPRTPAEIRNLICRMQSENDWGAPRIHAELLKLGMDISQTTVTMYLPKVQPVPDNVARWKAFLKNHMPEIAAMDFVTVPTATFKVLYCLFFIHPGRRRILHTNVTANPTADWVLQQLREVFFDGPGIQYLIHDRDSKFARVARWLKLAGADSVLTGYRSPWQNGIAERWVLTLRRELLDHVVVLSEAHARRLIADFVAYYNEDRCHLALNKDPPDPRPKQARPSCDAEVIAIPRVGDIHHRYEWRDAA